MATQAAASTSADGVRYVERAVRQLQRIQSRWEGERRAVLVRWADSAKAWQQERAELIAAREQLEQLFNEERAAFIEEIQRLVQQKLNLQNELAVRAAQLEATELGATGGRLTSDGQTDFTGLSGLNADLLAAVSADASAALEAESKAASGADSLSAHAASDPGAHSSAAAAVGEGHASEPAAVARVPGSPAISALTRSIRGEQQSIVARNQLEGMPQPSQSAFGSAVSSSHSSDSVLDAKSGAADLSPTHSSLSSPSAIGVASPNQPGEAQPAERALNRQALMMKLQFAKLKQELTARNDELSKARSENTALQQELALSQRSLEQARDRAQTLQVELDHRSQELAQARAELSAAQSSTKEAAASHSAETAQLRADLRQVKSQLETLLSYSEQKERDNARLRQENAQLTAQAREHQTKANMLLSFSNLKERELKEARAELERVRELWNEDKKQSLLQTIRVGGSGAGAASGAFSATSAAASSSIRDPSQ